MPSSEQKRDQAFELIASLDRHILQLEKLIGQEQEIAACKKAIERLKDSLTSKAMI